MKKNKKSSASSILVNMALAIFVAEAVVMFVLPVFGPHTLWHIALIDSALLIVFLSPLLYFLLFRPIVKEIAERREAEQALEKARSELEERVKERTAELLETNEMLNREFVRHKLADEALRESEMKFRSVAQSANDAIIAANSDDIIISWNRGAQKIFGYSEEEALGKPLTMLMPERYQGAHKKGIWRVHSTGKSKVVGKTLDFYGLRKNKEEFPLELSISTWTTGEETFFSGIIRDTTERKRAEEEKEKIQAQLLHAQKLEAVGRLIVGVAHEFTNIILSIKGYAGATMKKLDIKGPLYGQMKEIQTLVDRGTKITRQLLDFGRKEAVEFVVLDMNATMERLLKMVYHFIRPDIYVSVEPAKDLWMVNADMGNMEQVLMNLLVNAKDAIPKGGRLIIKTRNVTLDKKEAARIREARAGRFVCISVSDTGMGMEKAVADRIFDPFFTTKEKYGTGLGLSVVYGIINRHNGWINVESEVDKGTCFSFYLPAVFPDEEKEGKDK